jgi:hypothetical protein
MGETFGLSIAEFSIKNKPIITCSCGDLEHINILGELAIQYNSKEELVNIFTNIKNIIKSKTDWNAYKLYSPQYVMSLFQEYIFNNKLFIQNINKDKYINDDCTSNTTITNINTNINFIIVTSKWGINIAESLQLLLNNLGYDAYIITGQISKEILKNNESKPNELFIILFSHLLSELPKPNKYIIYQLEQKKESKYITNIVLKNILNSLISWDYSHENITGFDNKYKQKLMYQPVSIINLIQKTDIPIKYDLLFFGAFHKRRQDILQYFTEKKYNIFITHEIFGEELYKIIQQSKIILNIHAYENNSVLEIARLNEVLPFNKLIISEIPCQGDSVNKNFYNDKVIFSPIILQNLTNIKEMTSLIDYYLISDNYDNFIANNEKNINDIYLYSLEHLKKNISFIQENISLNNQNFTISQVDN